MVNKVILLGNLGADPELRYTQAGIPVCTLRLATNERWRNAKGEVEERTEWHRVVLFGRQAEVANQYLRKGRQVYIEGSIRSRKWQDQDGNDRYTFEIVARNMQLLGGRAGGEAPLEKVSEPPPGNPDLAEEFDDDIPF